jgi:hypothetical protein
MRRFAKQFVVVVVSLAVLCLCGLLVESKTFHQKRDEVVTRLPGKRLLGSPEPIWTLGYEHLPFAVLSQAVYGRSPSPKENDDRTCLNPDAILQEMGWSRWEHFPRPDLQQRFASVHLRAEVWSNRTDRRVVVAFAGTMFTNFQDWKANLRWFIPHHNDQYTEVVQTLGNEFAQEYLRLQQLPEWSFLKNAHIFSTGHSLGGGLAQQFAYSLPTAANVPSVEHVYAFDPSPVTGFYSVKKELRNRNKEKLSIDRIYERHEALSMIRSFENLVYPPTSKEPSIREVRYNLFPTLDPIAGHSIASFTCNLKEQLDSHVSVERMR